MNHVIQVQYCEPLKHNVYDLWQVIYAYNWIYGYIYEMQQFTYVIGTLQ